ncbi:MAG: histidinol-phosphatase [Pseudomonadota bacterium]
MSSLPLDALLATANRMADAAGRAALGHFRAAQLPTENKAAGDAFDPVTLADRQAEAAMREILAEDRPEDGILGEEHGTSQGKSGLTWVLDPIDGTRAFISGLPTWGILIALDDGTSGRIGIVDQPYIGERFVGCPDHGATLHRAGERRAIQTRPCPSFAEATLMTTDADLFSAGERGAFETLKDRCRLTRYGTDCYAYAMVAMGQVDLVIESGLEAYDIAAPAALVRAAGGVVTDWQGGDPRWGGRAVAAGDAALHAQALEILRTVAP